MSRVIIEVDNNLIANAIAFWFESDNALDSFLNSKHAGILSELREDGEDIPEIDYASVSLDQDDYGTNHIVTINLQ
jgi:hypothetical protein